jgi:hypothetical protein
LASFKVRDLMVTLFPEGGCQEGGWTTRCAEDSIQCPADSLVVKLPTPPRDAPMILCHATVPTEKMTKSQLEALKVELDFALDTVKKALKKPAKRAAKDRPLNVDGVLRAAKVGAKKSKSARKK